MVQTTYQKKNGELVNKITYLSEFGGVVNDSFPDIRRSQRNSLDLEI